MTQINVTHPVLLGKRVNRLAMKIRVVSIETWKEEIAIVSEAIVGTWLH